MSQDDEATFTLEEAIAVQRALRHSLGLGPERFPLPAFVGMISDEIEKLRAAGRSDEDIARLMETPLGRPFDPAALARFYASPNERHPKEHSDKA